MADGDALLVVVSHLARAINVHADITTLQHVVLKGHVVIALVVLAARLGANEAHATDRCCRVGLQIAAAHGEVMAAVDCLDSIGIILFRGYETHVLKRQMGRVDHIDHTLLVVA